MADFRKRKQNKEETLRTKLDALKEKKQVMIVLGVYNNVLNWIKDTNVVIK